MWQLCVACFASLSPNCERTVNIFLPVSNCVIPERIVEFIEHLRRQFAYDAWANREVLATLSASPRPTERPLQLLAHILSAERLWLERIRKQPQSLPVWPDFTLEQCEAQIAELARLWGEYLSQLSHAALPNRALRNRAFRQPRGYR